MTAHAITKEHFSPAGAPRWPSGKVTVPASMLAPPRCRSIKPAARTEEERRLQSLSLVRFGAIPPCRGTEACWGTEHSTLHHQSRALPPHLQRTYCSRSIYIPTQYFYNAGGGLQRPPGPSSGNWQSVRPRGRTTAHLLRWNGSHVYQTVQDHIWRHSGALGGRL